MNEQERLAALAKRKDQLSSVAVELGEDATPSDLMNILDAAESMLRRGHAKGEGIQTFVFRGEIGAAIAALAIESLSRIAEQRGVKTEAEPT